MSYKPTFIVGARAKIKVDGQTVAFATAVQYNVDVTHVPVECLGAYEVIAYEPVGYRVSGTMTVVRYTANGNTAAGPSGGAAAAGGNSPFNGFGAGSAGATVGAAATPAAFNPGNLLLSATFNIEVYDRRDGQANQSGQRFILIENARFEKRSGGINAKGLMEEQYSFNGILFSDDAATVVNSGPNA